MRIQNLTIEHDRSLTSIQQTNEEEKQFLLSQLQDSSNQVKELERDLYYYKHKTRELKKSLATSTSTALETSITSNQIPRRRESANNEDDFLTQLPTPRTAVQQQSSAPFLLKIGNRSTSAHQIPSDELKKR